MQPSSHSWKDHSAINSSDESQDSFIASAEAKRLAGGISDMTIWRWVRADIIPTPLKIRGRNYWRRGEFIRALETAAISDNSPTAA